MDRAVAYCMNTDCSEAHKGVFLLNRAEYACHLCREPGLVETETYKPDLRGSRFYRAAVVHFNFCPLGGYREQAIVEVNEPDVVGGGIVELFSPLVKAEKRALKLAEFILCEANREPHKQLKPTRTDTVISWDRSKHEDDEMFWKRYRAELADLADNAAALKRNLYGQ